MTLLIPLLMRLTTLFDRGVAADEPSADDSRPVDELVHEAPERE